MTFVKFGFRGKFEGKLNTFSQKNGKIHRNMSLDRAIKENDGESSTCRLQ